MDDIEIKQKVMNELQNMGFNFKHVGTIYLLETIQIVYNSKNPQIFKCIEKNIYPQVAEKHCKKVSTVKSDIIKATDYMYEQNLLEKKKTDIYYNLYPKMTPKTVINTIILKITA